MGVAKILHGIILPRKLLTYWNALPISQQSEELQLLNKADIETSSNGVHITAEQRLQDVALRYGKESVQYANMLELCKQLKLINS